MIAKLMAYIRFEEIKRGIPNILVSRLLASYLNIIRIIPNYNFVTITTVEKFR